MTQEKRIPDQTFSFVKQPLRERVFQMIAALYLIPALIMALVAPILAADWVAQPFIGGFVEQSMVFNGNNSTLRPSPWQMLRMNVNFGNQLQAIDGKVVRNAAEIRKVLKSYQVGDLVDLTVQSPEGEQRIYTVSLIRFPAADFWAYFIIPYLVGVIYLGSAVWMVATRRSEPAARNFVMFAISVSLATMGVFDLSTTHVFSWLWVLGMANCGAGLLNLALYFPSEIALYRRKPTLHMVWYGVGVLLSAVAWATMYNMDRPADYVWPWRMVYFFAGLCAILAFVRLLTRYSHSTSPMEREQIRLVLVGAGLSFIPPASWLFITPVLQTQIAFTPYIIFPLFVFPIITGYSIQRYRMLYTDYVFSRVFLYGLMGVLVAVGYALLSTGLSLVLMPVVGSNSPMVAGVTFFLLALTLMPLRNWLSSLVDRIFFRNNKAYEERLTAFTGALTEVVDLKGIIALLRKTIDDTLQPNQIHVFLFDPLSDQYLATEDSQGKPTSDLRFPVNSALAQVLNTRSHGALFISSFGEIPRSLQSDQARLKILGTQLFVHLPGRQRLAGWIALGQRLSGEPYTSQDVSFVETLADQAALAIERAQVVANMERRVREMNVLTRVAQGVNITIGLDDIFELTYAQASQLIETDDVRLMLVDAISGNLRQVFVIEQDERIWEEENKLVPEGKALEYEVIRSRRILITDDYAREFQRRGMEVPQTKVYAWMGVPLNAGAGTIGALSLSTRNSAVVYTREQAELIQAIADQVAGAIVKARLIEETERRARQLSTLNDVTRQLTSTVDLELLLQTILQSAVSILNCEAGSLLLVDPQTDELVFRVVDSPVANDLVGKRLPPGSGVVGRAVRSMMPVIVNDVASSPDWFSKTDRQTGFVTRALLVVPLVVKERVIGVIEVINRKDGVPFTAEDENLLMAFAAQAAIAIENARLFTMTDQALAERVEELSVMQRIDRELNTTLDASRAMRITLEWAMRQSHAAAGLVGIVYDDGLQIIASQGYGEELAAYQEALLPYAPYELQEVIRTGQPVQRAVAEQALLKGATVQVLLPLRREGVTNGLILLEAREGGMLAQEVVDFLTRLCDHASIAIANAQLYAAVQAASVAKSEFVSFVAHELKNPMTSIKGYTDFLAKGAVGPINEMQANFLAIIRSNIDRMNTLISDLNDLSKIEAGRLKMDFKDHVLADIVDEVIRSTKRQIDEKEQTLEIKLPEDLPKIWADRVRVVQILVNLVSNAYKYTDRGGTIYVCAERCENIWDANGPRQVVHIWVQDTGIGISPEDQKKIFQRFFRSDDQKAREAPGTGLGLNITRSLVEMQGGKIWFESEFRKGTTFHFTVPIAE